MNTYEKIIENYMKDFVKMMHKFLQTLHRYVPTDSIQIILDAYDRLSMGKIATRYYTIMKKFSVYLENKDETMFNESVVILPGVDIHSTWSQLSRGQKNKIWVYMQFLYKASAEICKYLNKKDESHQVEETQPEFNPFVGVGKKTSNYGTSQLFSGPKKLPGSKSSPSTGGIGTMMGAMGIDRMFDMGGLQDQLKNMSDDDIDNATNTISSLLGDAVDANTGKFMSGMIKKFVKEIGNSDETDNPLENFIRAAQIVMEEEESNAESLNIDPMAILNSAKKMIGAQRNENGDKMFNEENNPMNAIDKLLGMMGSDGENLKNMSENDCMNMISNMGVQLPRNFKLPNIKEDDIGNIHLNRKMKRKLKKRNKKRKKN